MPLGDACRPRDGHEMLHNFRLRSPFALLMMNMWSISGRVVAIAIAMWTLHGASAIAASNTIVTVAGTGVSVAGGDGGPASAATFNFPIGVDVGADGTVFVADATGSQVRRIDRNGLISTPAGVLYPTRVAAAPDGSVLIAAPMLGQVARLSAAGAVTVITAQAPPGPTAVAQAPDGSVIISDVNTTMVRRIDPAGGSSTVAGTGIPGFSGDGGPATAAQLNSPRDVAVAPDGSILIVDSFDHRVRRVDPAGVISTVAGTGTPGFSGDGGPATAAQLRFPEGVAVAGDGSVLIADRVNDRVRRVDPAGVISTLAGTGADGFSGDGGPAAAAALDDPADVAVTPDGSVLIADSLNRRIRSVDAGLGPTRSDADGEGARWPDVSRDVRPPEVSGSAVRGRRGQSAGRIKVRIRVSETSAVDVQLHDRAQRGGKRGAPVLASRRLERVRGAKTATTTIKVPARLAKRAGLSLRLRVTATDMAGNRATTTFTVRRARR
ncbi:hypothetical protein LRS13_06865 [Svornostia abyssi]|uniref:Teneurin NHL domain-containing protein n=1 Tax=Svornostia abyssi TaxID=2898438 RepID=A0ABY5PKN5_9ACTN|nr:hypothetical protein LRS13_06865 [Parviterribacteraceae bacterium J379]